MEFIDSNKIPEQTILSDVCIIGAGPAGISLAVKLADSNLDVIIAESGGERFDRESQKLNVLNIESNFRYRNGESRRNRQIGGTANVWAGRVVPFIFQPTLDDEWGDLKTSVLPFFDSAFQLFGIDPEIQNDHSDSDNELVAYWGCKTERFNSRSDILKKISNCRIYHFLTCTGEPQFVGNQIRKLSFFNKNRQRIHIQSRCFIFAMGAVENTRMLLMIRDQSNGNLHRQLKNAGKYMMDHPRIYHGSFLSLNEPSGISRYQIKRTDFGMYKTGIRNQAAITRVYCNLMKGVNRAAALIQQIPFQSFQVSSKRLILREKGILRMIAGESTRIPLPGRSTRFRNLMMDYFNRESLQDYHVMTYCEQRPREENQLVLENETGKFGLPIPRLKNNIHQDELNEVFLFYKMLENLAKKMNYTFEYDPHLLKDPSVYTDASHVMGGTRYSADKTRAAVRNDLSVTGVPNLFMAGSSVFPTGGVENPTHMIVALSCYLAEVLKKKLQ